MNKHWTVQVSYFKTLLNTANKLGLDSEALIAQCGLKEQDIADADKHVPLSALLSLFQRIDQQANNPNIGLTFGMSTSPSSFGLLGVLVGCCESFAQAFETMIPIRRVLMHTGTSKVQYHEDTTSFEWQPLSPELMQDRYLADAILSGWVNLGRKSYQDNFTPIKAELHYPEPDNLEALHEVFGENVVFNQPKIKLTFRNEDALHTDKPSNPRLVDQISQLAESRLRYKKDSMWNSLQVRRFIIQELPNSNANIKSVAKLMHMNERTLQRHLQAEGSSFQKLLNEVRLDISQKLLKNQEFPITNIALLLGYRENSGFTNAFRKWTDISPSEYRSRQLA